MDANTKPDNFMSVWETLTGPKHAWFGQWAHDRGNEVQKVGRDGFLDESMRWLDRYVKGDVGAGVDGDPAVTVQEGDGKFRPENAWPPSDARTFSMPLKAGSVQDAPNNDAEGETSGSYGNGIYSVSQPFPHDAHLAGVPRAKLDIGSAPSSRGHVYTLLYDVDPKGAGQLVTRGAHMVNKAGVVDVELYPEDWTIQKGHRLLLLTAGADLDWWNPPHSGGTIQVKGGTLTLPFLQYQRVAYLEGKEALAMEGRKNLQFDLDELADGKVNAQIPPAMTAFPPGLEPRGGRQITREQAQAMLGSAAQRRAAADAAARRGLQITLRYTRFRGRRFLVALVTGAERYRKVRLDLRRGTRTIRRATRRVRRGGTTRASFRMRGPIRNLRFTAVARNTGAKKRVMARSLAVRVK
jgi:hypothetical protein